MPQLEPLVLVILLGSNADPTADGMMAAARLALGPDAIVVADTSDTSSDADALEIGERVHARAVALVRWADGSFRVARLHVHVAPTHEWADDEIAFSPLDAAAEKGRTVGYTLASMVQRIERAHAEETASKPPPPPPALPTLEPARDTSKEPARTTRSAPAAVSPGVDLFVHGTGSLGGGATAVGGAGGIRWWPVAHVGLRAAVGARAGTIDEAAATTTTLFAAAGPAYRVPLSRALELGSRADFVLFHDSATRRHPTDTARARWLGAVDLVLETGWSIRHHAALIAGVGMELAFGSTTVRVGGAPVATIPPVRGIAELGARFRF